MRFGSLPVSHRSARPLPPTHAVAILGSTGSIGTQALDVVTHCTRMRAEQGEHAAPELIVTALAAGPSNLPLLARQAITYRPGIVATSGSADDAAELARLIEKGLRAEDLPVDAVPVDDPILGGTHGRSPEAAEPGRSDDRGNNRYSPEILYGPLAAKQVAEHAPGDTVLNGITGSIGLAPTLAALRAGKRLALANKESLIAGGRLVQEAVEASPLEQPLIPVDSEHSALAQALASGRDEEISRLIVTASGGPFRGKSREELADVTPAQALAHPTWDMGLVVTTNSATMVNKALEVLEAHLLFGIPLEDIVVAIHPQSMVHSLVEFVDGSTIAQVSPPDMRLPIALGLTWPYRVDGVAQGCDWSAPQQWDFEPLDHEAFPAVEMIKAAARTGGTGPAVFNAANEQAVAAFHDGQIPFTAIVDTVGEVLADHWSSEAFTTNADLSVEAVLAAEEWARNRADEILGDRTA